MSALRASALRALNSVENPRNASNPSSEKRRLSPGLSNKSRMRVAMAPTLTHRLQRDVSIWHAKVSACNACHLFETDSTLCAIRQRHVIAFRVWKVQAAVACVLFAVRNANGFLESGLCDLWEQEMPLPLVKVGWPPAKGRAVPQWAPPSATNAPRLRHDDDPVARAPSESRRLDGRYPQLPRPPCHHNPSRMRQPFFEV